jgi:hypothetical protein
MEDKNTTTVKNFSETLHAADRFEKLSDGWVKDKLLGVDWAPTSDKSMVFKDAQKYCADLNGRLPSIEELQTVIDYREENPAINEIFADTKTDDWYWSGTTTDWNKGRAWCVYFFYGDVYFSGNKDDDGYVRPVRASQ